MTFRIKIVFVSSPSLSSDYMNRLHVWRLKVSNKIVPWVWVKPLYIQNIAIIRLKGKEWKRASERMNVRTVSQSIVNWNTVCVQMSKSIQTPHRVNSNCGLKTLQLNFNHCCFLSIHSRSIVLLLCVVVGTHIPFDNANSHSHTETHTLIQFCAVAITTVLYVCVFSLHIAVKSSLPSVMCVVCRLFSINNIPNSV